MTAMNAMNADIYPLTIYYDSRCPLCLAEMESLKMHDDAGNLILSDIWTEGFQPPQGRTVDDLYNRLHAMRADGQLIDGLDVTRCAYQGVNMGWVTAPITWPVLRRVADAVYPVFARNRHRIPRWIGQTLLEYMARRALKKRCDKDGVCAIDPSAPASSPVQK